MNVCLLSWWWWLCDLIVYKMLKNRMMMMTIMRTLTWSLLQSCYSLSSADAKARVETNNDEREWRIDLFCHPAAKKCCACYSLFPLVCMCNHSVLHLLLLLFFYRKSNSVDELKQLHKLFSSHSLNYFSFSFARHLSRKRLEIVVAF
jgi:hypothetical protein